MEPVENNNNIKEEGEENDNEVDIDEIEAILGLEGKTKEISELFSNGKPHNFLEAVSLITNSNKFNDNQTSEEETNPDLKNVYINCSNFFMAENFDKFKIVFPKPVNIKEKNETLVKAKTIDNKESKNLSNKEGENVSNNLNNQNQAKEDKKQKQKNKKKKKKEEKKAEGKEVTEEQNKIQDTNNQNANQNEEKNTNNINTNQNNAEEKLNISNNQENETEQNNKKKIYRRLTKAGATLMRRPLLWIRANFFVIHLAAFNRRSSATVSPGIDHI